MACFERISGAICALMSAVCVAAPVTAQVALPCDGIEQADAIVEPWEENIAAFANGSVRVALLDGIEPAAAAAFLLVLYPPVDEVGARRCSVVGLDEGLGYGAIFFDELQATYDPSSGLTLNVPAVIYLPEQSFQNTALLSVTINQATGAVTVAQELGNE